MGWGKAFRIKLYDKYNGRCDYSGTLLERDWQIDHIIPKCHGGTDNIDNLVPCQKIVNHYKRALNVEDFRKQWLGGLHLRLAKLPKNPKVDRSIKRKKYLLEIAKLFGIKEDKPFSGVFYFEKIDNRG